ncbi:tRNA lysidine(34) synthetase TilS [Pseudovibrio sp. SPO723]|uniref:tRNA lysidine(34) synthetase TilS n=1 Tax=Nesiotobacter zosterae TaxID=392721 RepID=UPI0029C34F6A|nr:tRNA lysidine(34) synthetase TilS [Pseudovibrio sp. SPO723]MDX5595413.1 tRNA lysidine(34) synthetase TilS [Pseudovibrio sp. SPO723]
MPAVANSDHLPIEPDEADTLFRALNDLKAVAVGVSGGADSVALLVLLSEWAKRGDGKPAIAAITVDHGLRPEAATEAAGVALLCEQLGVSHKTLRWNGGGASGNLQAAAREARHGLLRNEALAQGCEAIVLAHHLEDQAETFLYRLARGSGVYGLGAMRPVRRDVMPPVMRPLLEVSKERLKASLRLRGIAWFEDPTNMDLHYERVRFRQAQPMLAELGLTPQRLSETAHRLARASDALDVWVTRFFEDYCTVHPAGPVRVMRSRFVELPEEVGLRLVARLVKLVGGGDYTPRLASVERLYEKLADPEFAGGGATLGGVRLHLRRDEAFIFKELGRVPPAEVDIHSVPEGAWDGRFTYRAQNVPEGSCLKVLGAGGFAEYGLEAFEDWPKTAFESAPIVVFPRGMPYIPWTGVQASLTSENTATRPCHVSVELIRSVL